MLSRTGAKEIRSLIESKIFTILLAVFFIVAARMSAQAPIHFGNLNVGSTATQTATLLFVNGGVPAGGAAVLTQGVEGYDFTASGTGSCITNGNGHNYAAGATCTLGVSFKALKPGARYGAARMVDGSGNVLALTFVSGVGIGPQVSYVVNSQGVYKANSQVAISGFSNPSNVAVDAAENVFVTDFDLGVVVEATAASNYQTTITLGGGLDTPQSLILDGAGNIYTANQNSNNVIEIPPGCASASCVITLPGTYTGAAGVAVDGDGNVYVAGQGSEEIDEIKTDGTTVKLATFTNSTTNPGIPDIALDSANNIFLVITNIPQVVEYFAASNYATTKTFDSGFTGTNLFIGGIVLDATGNIFLPEANSNAVHEITAASGYTQILTLANDLQSANGISVDARGNVYVTSEYTSNIYRLDYADAPALSFDTTNAGYTSADSPQTVYLVNNGNANLIFPIPATGTNPSFTSGAFALNTSVEGACTQLTPSSSSVAKLAPGIDCLLPVSFTPPNAGTFTGQLVLTDNSLNASGPSYAQQTINLNGKGIDITTTTAISSTAAAVFYENPVTITVTVSSTAGTPTGTVLLYDGATLLTTGELDANGTLSLSSSSWSAGNHKLTASYLGTPFFLPSASSPFVEQVVDFTIAPSGASTLTVRPGKYITYSIGLMPNAPATTFPGPILLSFTGVPIGSAGVLSTTSTTTGAGATTVQLKVSAPLGFAENVRQGRSGKPVIALAGLFAGLLLLRRRMMRVKKLLLLALVTLALSSLITACDSKINPGTWQLTITGTAGNLTHATTVTMNFD